MGSVDHGSYGNGILSYYLLGRSVTAWKKEDALFGLHSSRM